MLFGSYRANDRLRLRGARICRVAKAQPIPVAKRTCSLLAARCARAQAASCAHPPPSVCLAAVSIKIRDPRVLQPCLALAQEDSPRLRPGPTDELDGGTRSPQPRLHCRPSSGIHACLLCSPPRFDWRLRIPTEPLSGTVLCYCAVARWPAHGWRQLPR